MTKIKRQNIISGTEIFYSFLAYPIVADKIVWGYVRLKLGSPSKDLVFWGKPGQKLRFKVLPLSDKRHAKARSLYGFQYQILPEFLWVQDVPLPQHVHVIQQVKNKIVWEALRA